MEKSEYKDGSPTRQFLRRAKGPAPLPVANDQGSDPGIVKGLLTSS